jgi:hypothetical protein
MKRLLLLMTALTIASAAALPLQASAQVNVTLSIGTAPPPLRYEAVPPPRSGYVWAPGYWDWNGHTHVWADGHWERARVGYAYVRPEWREDHGQWRLYKGGWKHRDKMRHDGHNEYHCPPGQAKKGNC